MTGSVDYVDPAKVVDEIRKVHPELARIGTVYDASNQNSQVWIADLRSATGERGMTLEESTIATSADLETAARALVGRVDAILIGPDATVVGGLPAVGQVAATQQLPLYATAADVTTAGLVATLDPDYAALGRMAGEAASEVYTGKAAGEVAFRRPGELVWELNRGTVAQLGIDIPDDLLDRAGAAG